MEYRFKEVYFDIYCERCAHSDTKESEDPCDECLENPVNLYSHKPMYFEEKE